VTDYTIVIEAGQSNALPVGDIQGWEDLHPYFAIRSPKTLSSQIPQYSQGAYDDSYTMSGTFKGGPTTDENSSVVNGQWQKVNCRGVAVESLRCAVFYNPTAAGSVHGIVGNVARPTTAFPGRHEIAASPAPTPTKFTSNFRLQGPIADPASANIDSIYQPISGAPVFTVGSIDVPTNGDILRVSGTDSSGSWTPAFYTATLWEVTDVSSVTFKLKSYPAGVALTQNQAGISRPATGGSIDLTFKNYGASSAWTPTYTFTRRRTGTTHTATYPRALAVFGSDDDRYVSSNVTPTLNPPPEAGEQFDVTLTAVVATAKADPLQLNTYLGGIVSYSTRQTSTVQLGGGSSSGISVTSKERPLRIGQPFKLSSISGGAINGLAEGTTYWPVRKSGDNVFYISATPGGAELVTTAGSIDATATQTNVDVFGGSLTGLQVRCTSGANVGQTKNLKHVSYIPYAEIVLEGVATKLHFDGSWVSDVSATDTFVVEPPPVSGEAREFSKYCKLLPWSPFEGQARGRGLAGPTDVTIAHGGGDSAEVKAVGLATYYGAPVTLYATGGTLPNGLVPGKRYFVIKADGTTATLSETYGGTAILQTGAPGTGTYRMEIDEQFDRGNPFPPGFNYPGHYSQPSLYQPFGGPSVKGFEGISAGLQLALDLQQHHGKTVLYINCAFSGASIGQKIVVPGTTADQGFGWSDPKQQISWSPSEDNSCFQRFKDVLASVKVALAEEGSTGEVAAVAWVQGEEDATYADLSENYAANLRRLKTAMRSAIKDAGMFSSDAQRIKFLQPKIKQTNSVHAYASTVNAAIQETAEDDAYAQWVESDDLDMLSDSLVSISTDNYHYSGKSMDTLGRRMFDAWQNFQSSGYSEVQVCNLALAHLGDIGNITAIRPSDGSRQADLCAKYFDLSLNVVLQRHPWDFSIRRKQMTSVTCDRTEWQYSFYLPSDFVGVLAVLPEKPSDDVSWMGRKTSIEFAIEMDGSGRRRLYCNQDNVVLRYHAKVTDPSKYSEMFVQAFSWNLAAMLSAPLIKGDAGIAAAQRAQQMFEFMLQQAVGFDAVKTRERRLEDTTLAEWDRQRGESYDFNSWEDYR